MAKYKSKQFLALFNRFSKMFNTEGDVYLSIKTSVEEDYEHDLIPSNIEKKVVLTILKDAAIDFYKKDIDILSEEEYINSING